MIKQHSIAVLGAFRGEQASISDMKAYGTSKLMTIMSNSEIVRRLKGSGVDSFICQPGMSSTPVYKKTDKSHVMATVLDAAQTVIGQTEERGADRQDPLHILLCITVSVCACMVDTQSHVCTISILV